MNAANGENTFPEAEVAGIPNTPLSDFSTNGTTTNLDSDQTNSPGGLENLQIATSLMENRSYQESGTSLLGNSHNRNSLLNHSGHLHQSGHLLGSKKLSRSGHLGLSGGHLSHSGHLSRSDILSHSGHMSRPGHMMSGSRLSQSGNFNHSYSHSPFQEKVIKAPPGFSPKHLANSAGSSFLQGHMPSMESRLGGTAGLRNPFHEGQGGEVSGMGSSQQARSDLEKNLSDLGGSLSGRW